LNRVDGRVAIVTGAAGGIGSATARLLAQAGATVVATDLREDDGQALAADIDAGGGTAIYRQHDVTLEADWQSVVAETLSRYGRLDILVNNAGLYRHGRIEDTTIDQIDTLFDVNLKGVVLGTKHAFLAMKQRPRSAASASIINLSSIAGLIGSANSALYGMSKGGVRLYTKASAIEAAQLGYNIRCNSVHPGIVDTDMARGVASSMLARGVPQADVDKVMAGMHPLGRMAQAIDIARGIVYLASDDSSFMTGSELVIDGGWTAR
jgi:NAD(P)-dependent dehydrogenase (short-subunit alcohol dehydrogenase family)